MIDDNYEQILEGARLATMHVKRTKSMFLMELHTTAYYHHGDGEMQSPWIMQRVF